MELILQNAVRLAFAAFFGYATLLILEEAVGYLSHGDILEGLICLPPAALFAFLVVAAISEGLDAIRKDQEA